MSVYCRIRIFYIQDMYSILCKPVSMQTKYILHVCQEDGNSYVSLHFFRYAPEPRPRGSHSSQGSVGDEITRQKTSYTESAPPEPDQRSGSRTSSQSSMTQGAEAPPQSQTLPQTFGQNEPSEIPQEGSSTVPRQPSKSKGSSKSFPSFP